MNQFKISFKPSRLHQLLHYRFVVRDGVTLMEVIFAIGIILSGLLGLAALIPIAAGNAQATMEIDRSMSESTSAAAAGKVQQFHQLDQLVIFDNEAVGSPPLRGTGTDPYGFLPTNSPQTIQWKINSQQLVPAPPAPLNPFLGKLESPGFFVPDSKERRLAAGICIDPIGMPDVRLQTSFNASAENAYDHSRFPYYGERYQVLNPPNEAIGTVPAAPGWPMSPRMWRATIVNPAIDTPAPSPVTANYLLSPNVARRMFGGTGGLASVKSFEDGGLNGILVNRTDTNIGAGVFSVDAAMDRSSQYSWFATLSPPFSGSNPFRQSIVVVRQRFAPVPRRQNDALALNQTAYTISDPEENPSDERITWVGDRIGFQGGNGGEVLIYGSQAVSDDVVQGEWVMFSQQNFDAAGATGSVVHRWFEVLRVEQSETGTVDNAYAGFPNGGSIPVWRRWITLRGSDWSFGNSSLDQRNDTFCTIVNGAVSVSESLVNLDYGE